MPVPTTPLAQAKVKYENSLWAAKQAGYSYAEIATLGLGDPKARSRVYQIVKAVDARRKSRDE